MLLCQDLFTWYPWAKSLVAYQEMLLWPGGSARKTVLKNKDLCFLDDDHYEVDGDFEVPRHIFLKEDILGFGKDLRHCRSCRVSLADLAYW